MMFQYGLFVAGVLGAMVAIIGWRGIVTLLIAAGAAVWLIVKLVTVTVRVFQRRGKKCFGYLL